jgi:uncharacterized protein
MRVAITGSSGLIGRALVAALLEHGHEVLRLVRRPPGLDEAFWDPAQNLLPPDPLEGTDAVVNLSGVGIGDHRWSEQRKRAIYDSRILSTRLISRTAASLSAPPRVLVNASAVGFYGSRGDEVLTEESASGTGFTASLCRDWEEATGEAARAGTRVVNLRSGIVLAREGGALARQLPIFRLGLGGKLGRGDQWVTWIALRDEISVILHALVDESLSGAVNSCAPAPVTNAVFTKALGHALKRPTMFAVPRVALYGALGRELAEELALASQRAVPQRLSSAGFSFKDSSIDDAVHDVLSGP